MCAFKLLGTSKMGAKQSRCFHYDSDSNIKKRSKIVHTLPCPFFFFFFFFAPKNLLWFFGIGLIDCHSSARGKVAEIGLKSTINIAPTNLRFSQAKKPHNCIFHRNSIGRKLNGCLKKKRAGPITNIYLSDFTSYYYKKKKKPYQSQHVVWHKHSITKEHDHISASVQQQR